MIRITSKTRIMEIKIRHEIYVDKIDGIDETIIEMIMIEDVTKVPIVDGLFIKICE